MNPSNIHVHPELINQQPLTLVGLEYQGPFQWQNDLWQKFIPRIPEVKNRPDATTIYGYSYSSKEMFEKSQMIYMAAAPIKNKSEVPSGMVVRDVPAGVYAVITYTGPVSQAMTAMDYIYGTWFPKSGYQMDDRPILEFYGERFKVEAADSEIDILIPVKK